MRRTLFALVVVGLAVVGVRTTRAAAAIHLPFPQGTAISVIQGYYGGTHQGVEKYSLDLTRDDGKTSGSPALAPAPGTVVWSYPPGTGNGCIGIMIDAGAGLHEMLCHLILNHDYANGEHVGQGQELGTVGAPGLVGNNGVAHIHLQLYHVVNGARTPMPFAYPDGAPLEGVSLPATSTTFNLWGCNGSGPSCHMISQNSPAAPTTVPGPPPGPRTITSASTGSSAGATLATPRQSTDTLGVGVSFQVSGTGDCLRVHAQPAVSASTVGCLPDGTQGVITDGPQSADGYTWYKLDELGWSVGDYLQPMGGSAAGAPSQPATGTTAAAPATSAVTPSTPPATPPTPQASTAASSTAPAVPVTASAAPSTAPAAPPAPPAPPAPTLPTLAGTQPSPAPATEATPTTEPAAAPQSDSGSSTPANESPQAGSLTVGAAVLVTGAGDCVRVHDQPSTSGAVLGCLTDGTTGTIVDGPVSADGYTWWKLDGQGWVVADYLQVQ